MRTEDMCEYAPNCGVFAHTVPLFSYLSSVYSPDKDGGSYILIKDKEADEAFLQTLFRPEEDRHHLHPELPWRSSYRWFLSANVVPMEGPGSASSLGRSVGVSRFRVATRQRRSAVTRYSPLRTNRVILAHTPMHRSHVIYPENKSRGATPSKCDGAGHARRRAR